MGGPKDPAPGRSRPRRSPAPRPVVSTTTVVGPVRTCVGCREKGSRAELVRLVRDGDHVVVDVTRSAPGRGGWLHPRRDCLELALRRGAVPRALRLQGSMDVTAVLEWFAGLEDADRAPARAVQESTTSNESGSTR